MRRDFASDSCEVDNKTSARRPDRPMPAGPTGDKPQSGHSARSPQGAVCQPSSARHQPHEPIYSASNPWLVNLKVRLFSVTVRTTCSVAEPAWQHAANNDSGTSVGGVIYHALNRGNRREPVFHKPADHDAFIDVIAEARRRIPLATLEVVEPAGLACGRPAALAWRPDTARFCMGRSSQRTTLGGRPAEAPRIGCPPTPVWRPEVDALDGGEIGTGVEPPERWTAKETVIPSVPFLLPYRSRSLEDRAGAGPQHVSHAVG
jgi:hypothetical protein